MLSSVDQIGEPRPFLSLATIIHARDLYHRLQPPMPVPDHDLNLSFRNPASNTSSTVRDKKTLPFLFMPWPTMKQGIGKGVRLANEAYAATEG